MLVCMPIVLEELNLRKAERRLCEEALAMAGSIVEAAQLLGITRHALKRRIIKHDIEWPPRPAAPAAHPPQASAMMASQTSG